MSIVEKIMKVFFGDKSAKDIKQIQPIIDKALSYGEEFKNLTNDQLRANSETVSLRLWPKRKPASGNSRPKPRRKT